MVRATKLGGATPDQVRQDAKGMPGLDEGDAQQNRWRTYLRRNAGDARTLRCDLAGWESNLRRPRTVFQYRKIAQDHILPLMGKMRLQEIQPAHVKQLYARKKEEGRGPRTLQYIHSVLHCAMSKQYAKAYWDAILWMQSSDRRLNSRSLESGQKSSAVDS